jgi:hypothetical protein
VQRQEQGVNSRVATVAWRFSAMNGSKGVLLILVLFQADQSQSDCLEESGGGGDRGCHRDTAKKDRVAHTGGERWSKAGQ